MADQTHDDEPVREYQPNPNRRPWAVRFSDDRDHAGRPISLVVTPTNGKRLAPTDAAWLRELIHVGRTELDIPPTGSGDPTNAETDAAKYAPPAERTETP